MRIDRDANEYISHIEILNFLRDNREYTVSELDCYDLLKYFDSDEDGRLSYSDFQQMFLPCENNLMRKFTLERPAFRVGRYDNLPANMEIELSSLFFNEIAFLRRLRNLKEDLSYRYDYSNYSAYRTIDRWNEGFININNLRNFFRVNGVYLTDKEALAIIRRIDIDGDA